MADALDRVDKALGGTTEQNAWNNNSAVPLPDDGVTGRIIARRALEQAGKTRVVNPVTQDTRPSSLPLPE